VFHYSHYDPCCSVDFGAGGECCGGDSETTIKYNQKVYYTVAVTMNKCTYLLY
jgi:hypothetical protein